MTDWLKQVPRSDLNLIHHSLRMLATHPMTTDQTEITKLADSCWDESVARTEAVTSCDHDWHGGPVMDTYPPMLSRHCVKCDRWESSADPPLGDGQWHGPENDR